MTDIKSIVGRAVSLSRSASQQFNESVSEVRGLIVDLKRDLRKIASMPVTLEEALLRVERAVDSLTRTARELYPSASQFARPDYSGVRVNTDIIMIAQMADNMLATMTADVEKFYTTTTGISETDRVREVKVIERKILDAELAEESLIRSAEEAGFPIKRRGDADPRAVLAHEKVLP